MVSVDLLAPLAYVVVLVTALGIFSSVYRRRKAAASIDLPWFPTHNTRDAYISLLQQSPPPPESLLKSSLLLRAMADVRRILKLREDKTALTNLIQKGSIGDDLLVKFAKAEKELEAEVLDVVNEANSFTPAWGPGIFQTAQEMVMVQADSKHRDEIPRIHKLEALRVEQFKLFNSDKKLLPPSTSASISSPNTPAKGSPSATASLVLPSNIPVPSPSPSPSSRPTSPNRSLSPGASAKSTPKKKGKK
ncbi:Pre protein translocase subunit Sec66-domain-containing protein [Mrakia frigida]|uniref:Sec63 complex subunit SEC66 n=1 Tax=Mrakia frigida TaxID=29902 RepID=UPI003FCC1E99